MVFWYKAPHSGVGRVEAVVSHHPVVVHGKTIAGGALSIDVNFVSFNGQLMPFIGADDALIPSYVLDIDRNTLTFSRDLKALKIGHGVVHIQIFRELIQIGKQFKV